MAKTLNALIYPSSPSAIVERRMIDLETVPSHKASWWKPIVVAGDDAFDPATQKKTGPITTIEQTQVVDTYSIISLTAQEISDAKDAALSALNGSLYSTVGKVTFNHENRIRDLESKSQITMAQFKAGVKALL